MIRILTAEESLTYPINTIVPYPYGSNIKIVNGQLQPYLTIMSQMSADAASYLKVSERKVFLIGETPYPGYLNTTNLMRERLRRTLPNSDVIDVLRKDGQGNNNTYLQTEAIKENKKNEQVLVIALSYHLPRVIQAASAYRLNAVFVKAEDILKAAAINEYDKYLPFIEDLKHSEKLLRLVGELDRKGRLINGLISIRGPRLVDITSGEDGLYLENTSARKKMRGILASGSAQRLK